jgi:hypothetical protein
MGEPSIPYPDFAISIDYIASTAAPLPHQLPRPARAREPAGSYRADGSSMARLMALAMAW